MRIAIVEDNTLLRENLVLLIGGEAELEVCCNFGTAEEALPVILKNKPDILLVDLGLPGMSGIDLIRQIKVRHHDLDIMVYTAFDARNTVFSAIKAGAAGYILKDAPGQELVAAVRSVFSGEPVLHPSIARKVIQRALHSQTRDDGDELEVDLSEREREVLQLAAKGMSNQDIADVLHISIRTVQRHLNMIFNKLG